MAARNYLNWKWSIGTLALVLSIASLTVPANFDTATDAPTQ
ncbi:MAG: hypothetical protein P2A85_18775 [Microcoleus anatoxicus]